MLERNENVFIKESFLSYFSCSKEHDTLTGKEVIPSFSGSHAQVFLRKLYMLEKWLFRVLEADVSTKHITKQQI